MDEVIERVLARLDELGIDQKTFAKEIGVSPATVTDWKTGKSQSYMKKINIISAALASPSRWLVFGEGPHTKMEEARENGSLERSHRIAAKGNALQIIYADKDNMRAAFFDGAEDLTADELDALWQDAQEYLQFKIEQRRRERGKAD